MSRAKRKDDSLEALTAMDRAGGAAVFRGGGWKAGEASIEYSTAKGLIRDGLVEPLGLDRSGLPQRIELNLRGRDALEVKA